MRIVSVVAEAMPKRHHRFMATFSTSIRLPPAFKAEVDAFAGSLGISLNALIAVALRDYMDGRTSGPRPVPGAIPPAEPKPASAPSPAPKPVSPPVVSAPAPKPASLAQSAPVPAVSAKLPFKKPKNRDDPCPCGAMSADGYYRLKFRQCHGKKGMPG